MMDEITENERYITEQLSVVVLNNQLDLKLIRQHDLVQLQNHKKRSYLVNFAVALQNEIITTSFADSMIIKNELKLFHKGDDNNAFFKVVQKSQNKQKTLSLMYEMHDGKKVYISHAQAITAVEIWSMSMQGHSFQRLTLSSPQKAEDWIELIHKSGLLKK